MASNADFLRAMKEPVSVSSAAPIGIVIDPLERSKAQTLPNVTLVKADITPNVTEMNKKIEI